MQAMKCEICGSNDIVKQEGLFICQHCGTKYSVEEAKKLVGVVTIDKSEDIENWKILAQRARFEGNAQNAAKYYGLINEQDPHDWEASFFHTYYQAIDCKLAQIPSAQSAVSNAFYSTLLMLADDTEKMPETEKDAYFNNAFKQFYSAFSAFADSIVSSALKYKAESDRTGGSVTANNSVNEWLVSAMSLMHVLKIAAKGLVKDEALYFAILEKDIKLHCDYAYALKPETRNKFIQELEKEVKEIKPTYVMPEVKAPKSGCYIATCVYGSYDCPQVWTLRRYRDQKLTQMVWGRAFIRCYYAVSPTIVKLFGKTKLFHSFWKARLDRMVQRLNAEGFSSDRYQD